MRKLTKNQVANLALAAGFCRGLPHRKGPFVLDKLDRHCLRTAARLLKRLLDEQAKEGGQHGN